MLRASSRDAETGGGDGSDALGGAETIGAVFSTMRATLVIFAKSQCFALPGQRSNIGGSSWTTSSATDAG